MKQQFSLIFTIFLLAFTAYGQTNRGVLRGQVKDAADAVIVGATGTIVGTNGNEKTTQTNNSGAFVFQNLAAGKYTIRVQNQVSRHIKMRKWKFRQTKTRRSKSG